MRIDQSNFRVLTEVEIDMVAGGDSPTATELEIGTLIHGEGYTSEGTDENGHAWATTFNGITFVDTDGNGHFDHAEFSTGGQTYVYDPVTKTWRHEGRDDTEGDQEDELNPG